jgi:RNA polymerase sigma-70 factor, ECF subfamily
VTTRQDEFERIALPHASSLLRVARRLTPEPATAEDLVQEALLRAWRGFDQFQRGTNIRAWLFKIMINEFHAQGRKLRSRLALDELGSRGEREVPHEAGVSSFLDAAEVNRALNALSPEHRTALLLGVVEGFTCREVAGILALPIGTVMSRLSRARQALRDQLEGSPRRNEYVKQEAS